MAALPGPYFFAGMAGASYNSPRGLWVAGASKFHERQESLCCSRFLMVMIEILSLFPFFVDGDDHDPLVLLIPIMIILRLEPIDEGVLDVVPLHPHLDALDLARETVLGAQADENTICEDRLASATGSPSL